MHFSRWTTLLTGLVLGTAAFAVKLPQVRLLESKGWTVQHSVMSWDSLSIYFSAQSPGAASYDLFVLRAEGWRWGEPQRIDALSTDADELSPSVSSDESMLFYVHRTPSDPSDKHPYDRTQIWRAWQRNGQWTEPAPIIISGEEDDEPVMLEDNRTLTFKRRAESKKHDGAWQPYTATMIDDHNWTLPAAAAETPVPDPVLAASGTIVQLKTGRPLTTGRVMVYNAMDEQLLQTACVHSVLGRWRVPLQSGMHYRLAITAPGYSYHYIDVLTDSLAAREERSFDTIVLDDELALTLIIYDAETQEVLDTKKHILPLGRMHRLPLTRPDYDDYLLEVNTTRPMIFTETELDIPLQPTKSLHRFQVTDAKTDEAVADAILRLNGKPAPADTALRVRREMTLQATAPGYLFYDTLFHTGNDAAERTVRVRLRPLEKDLVLQLRNIQFEYDSYELTAESDDELESLAQLLFANPTLRIELSAHTDDQGSDRYNDRLSSLRGQAVAEWLKKRGVEAGRMEAVGYGKRKPLVDNDTEEHRALNRRVEIKVLDF